MKRQPRIADEPMDALLVVAESSLSPKPTSESGGLQRFAMQGGKSQQ
jgi:hypothetical protein